MHRNETPKQSLAEKATVKKECAISQWLCVAYHIGTSKPTHVCFLAFFWLFTFEGRQYEEPSSCGNAPLPRAQ